MLTILHFVYASCRKDKFELKECESVNFHDPHDRVAILALLKMRHFAQFVLVGCTHLWWNAKYGAHVHFHLFWCLLYHTHADKVVVCVLQESGPSDGGAL